METTVNVRKQPKYWAISLAAIMATAFVLVQPAMQASYGQLSGEDLVSGGYDQCDYREPDESPGTPDDPLTMNSVKNKDIMKTIIAEKEIYDCFLNQGNLPVIVDVTTYVEIFTNITSGERLGDHVFATTCIKEEDTAVVIDCESTPDDDPIPRTVVPVGSSCSEEIIEFPQEMNTLNKGRSAATVEVQKEQFICSLTGTEKKVDLYIVTSVFEDINTQTVKEVTFLEVRCVVQVFDSDDTTDGATVEGCTFSDLEN
jgi:hypothetical protein